MLDQFKNILHELVNRCDVIYIKRREKGNYLRRLTNNKIIELYEQPALQQFQAKFFHHLKTTPTSSFIKQHFVIHKKYQI